MAFAAIRARCTIQDTSAVLQACAKIVAKHGGFLQLLDPSVVFNERHLASAWSHAERAQREDHMTARSLEAEFLMYVTGQRQVSVALPMAGIRPGLEHAIICAAGERAATMIWGLLDALGWSRDPQGIGTNPGALERLGIERRGANEEDAVLEKVALVDLIK